MALSVKKIFISYAHKDESWKERLVTQLKVLELEGFCDVWDDRRIQVGDTWRNEIEKALNEADMVILLISANFLTSDFIRQEEVPKILSRRQKEGVWVIPVFVKPCAWNQVSWLSEIQGEPRNGKCLQELKRSGQADKILSELAKEIANRIKANPTNNNATTPTPFSTENPFTDTHVILEPTRFMGRGKEIRSLLKKLQNGMDASINESLLIKGCSVAIIGEPKIGKSSLLRYIKRLWEKANGRVIGPINLEGVDSSADFFDLIAEAVSVNKGDWPALRKRLLEFCGLLMIDELDIGPLHGFSNKDMRKLRGIIQENRGFKVVAASRVALKNVYEADKFGSFPTDFLEELQLGLMDEEECRLILEHPWAAEAAQFDRQTAATLLALAGCFPYKLQRAAFHRFEAWGNPAYDWLKEFQQDMERIK